MIENGAVADKKSMEFFDRHFLTKRVICLRLKTLWKNYFKLCERIWFDYVQRMTQNVRRCQFVTAITKTDQWQCTDIWLQRSLKSFWNVWDWHSAAFCCLFFDRQKSTNCFTIWIFSVSLKRWVVILVTWCISIKKESSIDFFLFLCPEEITVRSLYFDRLAQSLQSIAHLFLINWKHFSNIRPQKDRSSIPRLAFDWTILVMTLKANQGIY